MRLAVNYAVDRAAVARSQGGPELAQPTCQVRPPGAVGYRRYCPYTSDPGPTGEWKAPDLARARRLVAASGSRGMKVKVWTWPFLEPAARVAVATLRSLGYRASLKRVATIDAYFPKVVDAKTRAQAGMFGWFASGSSASSFLGELTLQLDSARAAEPQSQLLLRPADRCPDRAGAEDPGY